MSVPTENFRRQHEELMQLGMEILGQLQPETAAARATEIRRQLARFAGKLSVHASMEGDALYPRLLAHEQPDVRAIAATFVDELGGIYGAFGNFTRKWPDADSIARDPVTFVRHTRDVFKLLARRMMKETSELYPLVDDLG